jgi:hypothetical protein
MAAGDGNRVWFPEMIEMLRSQWNAAMPFPDLIELCNILDKHVSTTAAQRSCLAYGFSPSRMRENRGFRKSATSQHQRSGNYSVIGPIRYRLAGSDQAD